MEMPQVPPISILLVEDDRRDAELITELLRKSDVGISVDVASNAEEGLTKAFNTRFDLIICDYCLPGMDGLSFVKVVKKTKGTIPILMLTGYPDQELEAQIIRHGSCTYLSKNADPKIFLNVVKEALAMLPNWVV
jgi:CheY-like chemotaxis protein